MKIIVCKDYAELSEVAAGIVAEQIKEKKNSVLGLATGSSPLGLYGALVEKYERGEISFKDVGTVNLDEYCGLAPDDDRSYRHFMYNNLFRRVDIDCGRTNIPNGMDPDAAAETARYDAVIKALGGIDLQLLGIGIDGHIGFNEPAEAFTDGTSRIKLDESTREANARFFKSIDEVPKYAYTMGCGTIISAKKILVVANGGNKASILEEAFFGKVTPAVPASILQTVSDRVYLVIDEEAASEIVKKHPQAVVRP